MPVQDHGNHGICCHQITGRPYMTPIQKRVFGIDHPGHLSGQPLLFAASQL